MKTLQKAGGRVEIEARVRRLYAQEEAVCRRTRERRHVEHRVIRLRQLVERPHGDERRQRRAEHRGFEGDRNELRPAVERTAADVQWIGDRLRPVLEAE